MEQQDQAPLPGARPWRELASSLASWVASLSGSAFSFSLATSTLLVLLLVVVLITWRLAQRRYKRMMEGKLSQV